MLFSALNTVVNAQEVIEGDDFPEALGTFVQTTPLTLDDKAMSYDFSFGIATAMTVEQAEEECSVYEAASQVKGRNPWIYAGTVSGFKSAWDLGQKLKNLFSNDSIAYLKIVNTGNGWAVYYKRGK